MSFELSWHVPKRIIYVRLTEEMGLDALEAFALGIKDMANEGVAPVHLLFDDAEAGNPPTSIGEIKSRLELARHPSLGWVVAIGETKPVANFLISVLMKILAVDFVRRPTADAALEFLKGRDASLEK
jgi:hypothetical protein